MTNPPNSIEWLQNALPKYRALVHQDGTVFPCTPEELGAVLTRIQDGTITRDGAKQVLATLQKENMEFVRQVNATYKELLGNEGTSTPS